MIIKNSEDLWLKKTPTNKQKPSLPLLMATHYFKCEVPGTNPCSLLEQLSQSLEAHYSGVTAPRALTGIVPSKKEGSKTRTVRKTLSVMLSFPLPEEKAIAFNHCRSWTALQAVNRWKRRPPWSFKKSRKIRFMECELQRNYEERPFLYYVGGFLWFEFIYGNSRTCNCFESLWI